MRQLDRWLGKVALRSALLTGPLLRKGPPVPQRVVIAKFFGLGSLLQTYRLLDALRAEGYAVGLLTFQNNIPFLKQMRGIEQFFPIDPRSATSIGLSSWKAARAVNRWRPQVYLDLELFSYYSAVMGALSNAPTRIAFFSAIRPRLSYMTHRIRLNPFVHISRNYLQFARPLISSETFQKAERRFTPEEIFTRIPPFSMPSPYVVLAPFGSDTLGHLKIWPPDYWQQLVRLMVRKRPELKFLMVGAPSDAPKAQALMRTVTLPNFTNLVGKTSLDEFIGVMAHATLTVTIDSFPFHLSTLLGRPTIGFFGPETPLHYGADDQPRSIALTAGIHCSPCINVYAGKVSELACTNNVCLQKILPEEVMQTIETRGWLD